MPPKVKVTREDIIEKALELLRLRGDSGINARSVAAELSASTQPVFSNFSTMEELKVAVAEAAYKLYLSFIEKEVMSGKYPRYKSFGIAYIRFAKEEKELFKFLFMCDRNGKDLSPGEDFKASVEMIMNTNGFSRERAELMHLEMWACVHGIASMAATSFLELDDELISRMVSDVYQGVRRIQMEGDNGGN